MSPALAPAVGSAAAPAPRYVLRLYVAGSSPLSAGAIAAARRLCESYLRGEYRLTVVDLYQQPEVAEAERIVAVPALDKLMPAPRRRLVGDLTDAARVLEALGLDAGEGRDDD